MSTARSSLLTIVAIAVALGVAGAYITQSGQQAQLREEITALRSELSNLRQGVADLASKLGQVTQTSLSAQNVSALPALYRSAKDSVVSIESGLPQGTAQGSGFVYDALGHIVTNNHVVEGADRVFVTFVDGTRVKAAVVGNDVYSDLAVLRISTEGVSLRPLPMADSSQLMVGDPVVAIGNPFGLSGSLTTGVVSQIGRTLRTAGGYSLPNVIQIDAVINPGNSGGPLLDYSGRVIGVTTAIATETGTFSGVGFAIPSNTISREVPGLISKGRYEHPWLGVEGIDLTDEVAQAMKLDRTAGWLIVRVIEGGPAERDGLKGGTSTTRIDDSLVTLGGDVIIGLNGSAIRNGDDLSSLLEEMKPGDIVSLRIIRNGVEIVRAITLGIRPLPSSS